MSDAIRVGLVGFGYASKTFHAPLIGGTPGMALKAVASSDADKVHADWPGVKVMSAPGDLLDDPDIDLVVIATPNDTHFPLAKAALEAGKHVVVDKPFTVHCHKLASWKAWRSTAVGYFRCFITGAGTAIS